MTTKTIEQLQTEIEKLVHAHLTEQRAAATAAVERAFAAATTPKAARVPRAEAWGRRRPPTEVAGLAEKLLDVVRAHPGETMATIAPHVGEPARALNRPMHHLKQAACAPWVSGT